MFINSITHLACDHDRRRRHFKQERDRKRAARERQRTHDNMIREEAIRLASKLTQRQEEACIIATKTDLEQMFWLIQNLNSPTPIFVISPSWLKHAGDGVFVSRWYLFAPRGLILPMFGYSSLSKYQATDCRQSYQGLTIRPELFFHGIKSTDRMRYTPEMIGNYVNRPAWPSQEWSDIGRADIIEPPRTCYRKSNVSYIIQLAGILPHLKLVQGSIHTGRELFFCYDFVANVNVHPNPCFDCLNRDVNVLLGNNDDVIHKPLLYRQGHSLSDLVIN